MKKQLMWYKVKYSSSEILDNGKQMNTLDYFIVDCSNFAEAGYKVLEYFNGEGEIEEVSLQKTWKPLGNTNYGPNNKVFMVKFAEDYADENGNIKTIKYPVPFYANNNSDLQKILDIYLKQGLEDMRVTTVSETRWKIIN